MCYINYQSNYTTRIVLKWKADIKVRILKSKNCHKIRGEIYFKLRIRKKKTAPRYTLASLIIFHKIVYAGLNPCMIAYKKKPCSIDVLQKNVRYKVKPLKLNDTFIGKPYHVAFFCTIHNTHFDTLFKKFANELPYAAYLTLRQKGFLSFTCAYMRTCARSATRTFARILAHAKLTDVLWLA